MKCGFNLASKVRINAIEFQDRIAQLLSSFCGILLQKGTEILFKIDCHAGTQDVVDCLGCNFANSANNHRRYDNDDSGSLIRVVTRHQTLHYDLSIVSERGKNRQYPLKYLTNNALALDLAQNFLHLLMHLLEYNSAADIECIRKIRFRIRKKVCTEDQKGCMQLGLSICAVWVTLCLQWDSKVFRDEVNLH